MPNVFVAPGLSAVGALPDDLPLEHTADLIYQSFSEYYDLFSGNGKALLGSIRNQLREEYSEIGNTKVLSHANEISGVYSWYLAEEMQERQMISLRMLLDIADADVNLFQDLEAFKQQASVVDVNSAYLARVAVCASSRGCGYGKRLLKDFEEEALAHHRRIVSVHVRSSNDCAIHLYRSAGYETVSSEALGYYSMQKRL